MEAKDYMHTLICIVEHAVFWTSWPYQRFPLRRISRNQAFGDRIEHLKAAQIQVDSNGFLLLLVRHLLLVAMHLFLVASLLLLVSHLLLVAMHLFLLASLLLLVRHLLLVTW